jgi:glycosyltransferase involved in cell wall biosynthesis
MGVGMGNLPISVIIVARNAEKTIEECLKSVQRDEPAEIILVDGNSTDSTVEIARRYTELIFSDGGRGLNYAHQLGAEQTTQENIAYVDSDVILTDGALATMLAEFRGSGYISMLAREAPNREFSHYWEWAQYQHNQFRNLEGHLGTLASLFKRETILKYGFDLSERDLDDADLELRLKAEGYKFGVSSALYYHQYRVNLKSLVRYRFFLGRVGARYIRKYGPWHTGFWAPLHMCYWLGVCLIKGKPKLIPYFMVVGMAQTAGMVKGFFELVGGPSRRSKDVT